MAGATQETATARLARLLTMVPWLLNRQGIDVQQAADDLGPGQVTQLVTLVEAADELEVVGLLDGPADGGPHPTGRADDGHPRRIHGLHCSQPTHSRARGTASPTRAVVHLLFICGPLVGYPWVNRR